MHLQFGVSGVALAIVSHRSLFPSNQSLYLSVSGLLDLSNVTKITNALEKPFSAEPCSVVSVVTRTGYPNGVSNGLFANNCAWWYQ